MRSGARGQVLDERRDESAHELHPDLALLLSTSGLDRVAEARPPLARQPDGQRRRRSPTYLGIRDDRPRRPPRCRCTTATGCRSCNSHLLARRQPACSPTCRSSTPCFWDAVRATPARRRSPACPTRSTCSTASASPTWTCRRLRYVTQAGGRLAPDRVARYAELGQRARLGPVRDVRPDRGDRPDGLPAAGPRARRDPQAIGVADPGRRVPADAVDGRATRRARLLRSRT